MYRFAYWNDASGAPSQPASQHWFVNMDVEASGGQNGVRWMEITAPQTVVQPTALSVYQQGTYAPDGVWRWMGSLTRDKVGNIALGFSKSCGDTCPGGTPTYPSIGVAAARLALPWHHQAEVTGGRGKGSQPGTSNRWGDYSSMRIDQDGCTFWYTQEYYTTTAQFDWSTQVGSFTFAGCNGSGSPQVTLTPPSLKWGKIAVGTTAAGKKKVIVSNTGSAGLTISTIAATGDFALYPVKQTKKITPCVNGSVVAAGATCEIKVSFSPTQTGVRTGGISFTDNASGSPQSVTLTGTGK